MSDILIQMLSYPFLTRAIIVGILVALCASLLGVTLVLKHYSMIGDGLSHIGFGALAIATAFNFAPLAVAVPVVVITAFLLLRLSESATIKGDSAIALISTGALAIGVMVISVTKGVNIDIFNYMFGSILALSQSDVIISVILSIAVLVLYVLFYPQIFAITFDENFSRATGIKTELFNMLIALLTAITIVIGMRLVGAMLISALIIFPPLTAMRIFKSFKSVVIASAIISVICFIIGIICSYTASTPAGASVVTVNILAFIVFSILKAVKSK